jgi:ferritin-like metal-binding protein YciE
VLFLELRKIMKQPNDLQELLLEKLRLIYDAENRQLKAIQRWLKAAQSERLMEVLERHLEETEQHIERLDRVFESLGESAKGTKCAAMEGLVQEVQDAITEFKGSSVLDAALIDALQKIEHYEIASYGTVSTWCDLLGQDEAGDYLKETLDEEKTQDEYLTEIAESEINVEPAEEKS